MSQASSNPTATADANLVSVTVRLSKQDLATIAELSDRLGVSADEVIRRAIATEKLILDQQQSGRQVVVTEKGNVGNVKGLIVAS